VKVAIMQPTFLPWQGYFELIYQADRFVFADDAQFSHQSYHQRNRMFVNVRQGKVAWLSIPVQRDSFRMPLNHTRIAETEPWRLKMWRQIADNYAKTPFFPQVAPTVKEWLLAPAESLADQNIAFIRLACDLMGIRREFRLASDRTSGLSRSERAVDILRWCEADVYLSPRGSFGYMKSDGLFPVHGITAFFQDFQPKPYTQTGFSGEFVPYLSVLDALFNVGPETTLQLIKNGTPKWLAWDEMVASSDTAPSHDEGAGSEEA
jgi:hypothetical protein